MTDNEVFDQWLVNLRREAESAGSASGYWKRYPHFDNRLTSDDIAGWRERLLNPDFIRQWAFYPFVRREVVKKRYGDVPICRAKEKPVDYRRKLKKPKIRPICYAAHRDSLVYSWYAYKLHRLLEEKIQVAGVSESVLAYRSLTGRCNVHFAKEAFDYVRANAPCVALAFDVSSFFDTLDHSLLKQAWCDLLATPRLPPDHYTVFRSMTRFRVVRYEKLVELFGKARMKKWPLRKRFTYPKSFREKILPLLDPPCTVGIPQGSPLSAVLSNLYMLAADAELNRYAAQHDGYYRRYCDDILLIVPEGKQRDAVETVQKVLSNLKLAVNDDKTDVRQFRPAGTTLSCCNTQGEPSKLQYLGLDFDGQAIRLRPSSLARYHQKMRKAVRVAVIRAFGKRSKEHGRVFKAKLYTKYTKKGVEMGETNFISYARYAHRITGSQEILNQVRGCMEWVDHCIKVDKDRWPRIQQKIRARQLKEKEGRAAQLPVAASVVLVT